MQIGSTWLVYSLELVLLFLHQINMAKIIIVQVTMKRLALWLSVLLWSCCHMATSTDCDHFNFDNSLEDDSDYVDGSGGYNVGGGPC